PVPAPPPREMAPADLDHFERLWTQVLEILEREAPPTRGFLDGSRPTRVDEDSLEVTVTSRVRADMLGRHEHRERVRNAVATVSGRRLAVDFQAGAALPEDPGSAGPEAPRDDEALLREFKSMFRAVEDGEGP
ncbi:MAG: hypothetical protein JHC74_02520, partial [Thermoleophilia bacterium]|nr:hypothetical protein [Thermoleophilia bacterium]